MSKSKMDAKAVAAWIKSRWALVFFVAVVVLLVPAMVYFAMSMTTAKHQAFQKQVEDDAKDFKVASINYSVPSLTSGEKLVEQNAAPNEKLFNAYKAARDAQQAAAAELVSEAVKVNKGQGDALHKPLIDGFFPVQGPANVALAKQFRRVYVSDAMRALLEMVRAKEPVSAAALGQKLRDAEQSFLASELGNDASKGRAALSEDKNKTLDAQLVSNRLKEYRDRAHTLGLYAGMEIFTLPKVDEAVTPTPVELWDWQVQYWAMQDAMRAVAEVNKPAKDFGVTASIIKRIERLSVDPDPALAGVASALSDPAAPAPAPGATGDASDYARSITGRHTGTLYDVRSVHLTCVVSQKDLPRLFDALAASNMLTVTDVMLAKVDPVAELRNGYFYGEDAVVRADITIESLWLREWTRDLMPKEVKVALGLEAPDPNAPPAPGAPGAPIAPQPAGRRAGGAAGG